MIPELNKDYRITQEFTGQGKLGAGLFVGCPILQAILWNMYVYEPRSNGGALLFLVAASIGFLVGIVLMLVGRQQLATIVGEVIELKPAVEAVKPYDPSAPRPQNFPVGRQA